MPTKIILVEKGKYADLIKWYSDTGVCDTCGSPGGVKKLYQYGFEYPEGKVWTGGEFCSKRCWNARKVRKVTRK